MSDDFLESLRIPPEEMPAPSDGRKSREPKSHRRLWFKVDYETQLELANATRDPMIAVLVELPRLRYKLPKHDKSRPVELSMDMFDRLGFDRHQRCRVLKLLEQAGFIKVEWRKNLAPLVTFLQLWWLP